MRKPGVGSVVRAAALVLLVAADQLAKWAVAGSLKGAPPLVLIDGVLELVYTENTGAAFGVFAGGNTTLTLSGLLAVGLLGWLYSRLPKAPAWNRLKNTGVVLIAGALGNLIDRVARGFVVDFIYFVPIDFPRFNLADAYLVVSLAVLFCLLLWGYSEAQLKEIRLFQSREKPKKRP